MYYQAIFKLEPCQKNGTHLQAFLPGKKVNEKHFINMLAKGEIRIDDDRTITAAQRGLLFALFKDVEKKMYGENTKESLERVKEELKVRFCVETKKDYFSLSDVSLTLACEFIDYVLDFTFANKINLKFESFNAAKDWRTWSYLCFKHRECTICRKEHAEVHHITAVGIGRNRNKVDHSKMLLIMLCRHHHEMAHRMGWTTFSNKNHVAGIFVSVGTLKALNIKGEYGKEATLVIEDCMEERKMENDIG